VPLRGRSVPPCEIRDVPAVGVLSTVDCLRAPGSVPPTPVTPRRLVPRMRRGSVRNLFIFLANVDMGQTIKAPVYSVPVMDPKGPIFIDLCLNPKGVLAPEKSPFLQGMPRRRWKTWNERLHRAVLTVGNNAWKAFIVRVIRPSSWTPKSYHHMILPPMR
jgi:hypothetical protein